MPEVVPAEGLFYRNSVFGIPDKSSKTEGTPCQEYARYGLTLSESNIYC